ncbi:hypothetical protein FB567DRAFT_158057 [Paraphoma chrysanthemicola]|uniref:Uncharacterized protein n=1 Tax=Paraphoma chrysanthemicola TaxID=798071 RepID=A0A8K0RGC1_9PLEO|nr:hypothetical protein FB567DRAFT_249116 [Paraphoma chrysanthemicola]KAH7092902.1 hypothetical protein FB567DRAFT_158057 [Paraphoma chrysanthemicola]
MEYLQALPARAVSCNTTDFVAAPSQQPDDGDASGQLRSINQVSLAFLENMKLRFGEHSYESAKIHDITRKFGRGEISKKETFSIISDTIRNHDDLRHDLLAILNHEEARWAPGDFDLPQEPVPQFLQPAHQPQMRLPSLSTLWDSSRRDYTPLAPMTYSSNSAHASFEYTGGEDGVGTLCGEDTQLYADSAMPSHFDSVSSNELFTRQPGALGPKFLSNSSSTPNFAHGFAADQANVDLGGTWKPQQSQFFTTWSVVDYGDEWSADRQHTFDENERSAEIAQSPRTLSAMRSPVDVQGNQWDTPLPPFRRQEQFDTHVLPSLRISLDLSPTSTSAAISAEMPPPASLPGRDMSSLDGKPEETPATPKENHSLEDARGPKIASKRRKKSIKAESTMDPTRNEGSGDFVHGLCGKRFATRSKVKKHHWGNRNDDLDTKTGCWAKHNKPDANWDDHPSCRIELKPRMVKEPRALPKPSRIEDRPESTEHKAPVVPAMVPTYRTTPFASSMQQNHACEQAQMSDPSRPSGQYAETSYLPYHTHRLPSRSSFESLLSAVNLASQIEAPVPQGRNDSLVHQLDAQAAATERGSQYLPAWAVSTVQSDDDPGFGGPLPLPASRYVSDRAIPDHARASLKSLPHPSHMSGYGCSPMAASPTTLQQHTRDDTASADIMNEVPSDDPDLYPWERRSSVQWSG